MNRSTSTPKKRSQPKKPENLEGIFMILKAMLARYVPPLTPIYDKPDRYELVSKKPIEFMGVKKEAVCFASTRIQGSFVGLYLMHVYMQPKNLEKLGPRLRKALKGKTCFHIKEIDQELTK